MRPFTRAMSHSAKKKVLFLTIGTAVASGELMGVAPIGLGRIPGSRRGSTCLLLFHVLASSALFRANHTRSSAKLIGSRTRQELKLGIAAAHFRIDGRHDDADFANQVGTHIGRGIGVRGEPRTPGRVDAIPHDIRGAESAQTGEAATDTVGIEANTRNQTVDLHDVVADRGQDPARGFAKALRQPTNSTSRATYRPQPSLRPTGPGLQPAMRNSTGPCRHFPAGPLYTSESENQEVPRSPCRFREAGWQSCTTRIHS